MQWIKSICELSQNKTGRLILVKPKLKKKST